MFLATQIDWQKLLIPEQPAVESVIRGTIVYLLLFVVMRFLLKRRSGGLGMADVLVVVLIADAVQNAMGSEYKSVTEGVLNMYQCSKRKRASLRLCTATGLEERNGDFDGATYGLALGAAYQMLKRGSPVFEIARAIHALALAPSAMRSAREGALSLSPPAFMYCCAILPIDRQFSEFSYFTTRSSRLSRPRRGSRS
jgi:hypothetical protein